MELEPGAVLVLRQVLYMPRSAPVGGACVVDFSDSYPYLVPRVTCTLVLNQSALKSKAWERG